MADLRRIVALLRPYWPYLGQSLLVSGLMTVLALPGPYVTKLLLDEAYPQRDHGLLQLLLLGAAAFAVFQGAMQVVSGYFGRQVGLAMSYDLQSRLYRHVQGQDLGFFERHETGEILSRFDDLESSTSGVIAIVSTVILNSLQLLVFPALLIWIHPTLAALCLLVLPFDAALALFAGGYARRYAQRIAEAGARLSARTVESLAGIRTIQSLAAEASFLRGIRGGLEEVARLQVRAGALDGGVGLVATVVRSTGALAYGWYGWTQVLDGRLTPGTFLAFSAYAGFLYAPLQEIITLWPQVQAVRVHIGRFLEVYDRRPRVASPTAAIVHGLRGGDIELCGVVFGYGGEPVLHGVDAVFPARRVTALVGRSGAGKSTLVHLIPRFFDPQEGRVSVDGADVRRLDLRDLRRRVGFALQGASLFQGTIRDNLTLGADVPQTDLEDAARLACIDDCIADLPEGYDSSLGEGGGGLSAGQQQRLTLARVLLLDTPILILDEPTSALDVETEDRVCTALRMICEGRTVILIAHRPRTIAAADEVVTLADGRVETDLDSPGAVALAA